MEVLGTFIDVHVSRLYLPIPEDKVLHSYIPPPHPSSLYLSSDVIITKSSNLDNTTHKGGSRGRERGKISHPYRYISSTYNQEIEIGIEKSDCY